MGPYDLPTCHSAAGAVCIWSYDLATHSLLEKERSLEVLQRHLASCTPLVEGSPARARGS